VLGDSATRSEFFSRQYVGLNSHKRAGGQRNNSARRWPRARIPPPLRSSFPATRGAANRKRLFAPCVFGVASPPSRFIIAMLRESGGRPPLPPAMLIPRDSRLVP